MTKPDIIREKPITLAELKEALEQKPAEEMHFRRERTLEYLNQFVSIPAKKAAELRKKIEELGIPRLREEHLVKLIDLLPTTAEEVKSVLSSYTITITNENIKKLADCIKDTTA